MENSENYYFRNISFIKNYFVGSSFKIPNQIIDTLQQIQKDFLWNSFSPKVKHETICKEFQHGGLKNVNIILKIIS